jgi:hypothetical protein
VGQRETAPVDCGLAKTDGIGYALPVPQRHM